MAEEKSPKKPSTVWDKLTLAGMTLADAYREIDRHMDDKAYKPVTIGGRQFTDIKPNWMYELIDECFGPCGIGWGFDVTSREYIGFRTYTSKSNKEVTEHAASADVLLWYILADGTRGAYGPVPGGAKNSERQYAESGAVTNAVGKALSFMGAQRHIYKNADPAGTEPEFDAAAEFKRLMTLAKDNETIDAVKERLGAEDVKAALAIYSAMSDEERGVLEVIAMGGK